MDKNSCVCFRVAGEHELKLLRSWTIILYNGVGEFCASFCKLPFTITLEVASSSKPFSLCPRARCQIQEESDLRWLRILETCLLYRQWQKHEDERFHNWICTAYCDQLEANNIGVFIEWEFRFLWRWIRRFCLIECTPCNLVEGSRNSEKLPIPIFEYCPEDV